MQTTLVRIALVIGVLWVPITPAVGQPGAQYGARGFAVEVSLGTSFPNGYAVNLPEDIGLHAGLSGVWNRSSRLGLRGDIVVQMLSGAVATPTCVASAPCRGRALHPDQVYSVAMSVEYRPFMAVRRLYALAGGGVYYARGPQATSFGATAAALGGAGLDLAPRGHAGFSVEATYHHLADPFGTLSGILTPSLRFRF